MKGKTVKLILETVGQIDNIAKGLNINKEAMDKHASTLTAVRTRLDKYTEQYKNEEYMKTLSPAEQQNLMQNARVIYDVHEKLRKELDYLDMTKQPLFITNAVLALDKCYILLDYFYKERVGECGDIVIPHLQVIELKYVSKSNYKQLVSSLTLELDAFVNDIYVDFLTESNRIYFETVADLRIFTNSLMPAIEAYMWFKKEKERLEVEALPEINKIDLPEETTPQVPKGPAAVESVK